MATKTKTKAGPIVGHALVGALPVGSTYEGYRMGKHYGHPVVGGVTGTLVPTTGVIAGGFMGYQKQIHQQSVDAQRARQHKANRAVMKAGKGRL